MIHNNNHAPFALPRQGVYNLPFLAILPLNFTGSINPTPHTVSLWIMTWFLPGLALLQYARQGIVIDAQARTAI